MDRDRDIHATPAYGRDYRNRADVLADWDADKDFRCALTGRYFNKRDLAAFEAQVWLRYDKIRKVVRVK
jgi:hypothetical protein